MESVGKRAAEDVHRAVETYTYPLVKRHVGMIERWGAIDRGLSGKARGRYQRAFHRALKARKGE